MPASAHIALIVLVWCQLRSSPYPRFLSSLISVLFVILSHHFCSQNYSSYTIVAYVRGTGLMFHRQGQLLCLPKYENLVFCVASGCKIRSQFLSRNSLCVRVQDTNRLAQFEDSFPSVVQQHTFMGASSLIPFANTKLSNLRTQRSQRVLAVSAGVTSYCSIWAFPMTFRLYFPLFLNQVLVHTFIPRRHV